MPRKIIIALLAWAGFAHGYIRNATSAATPLFRTDATNVQFQVNTSFKAGAVNSNGAVMITATSDPMAGLTAATATWSAVSGSTIRFAPLKTTTAEHVNDGQHVITITDSPEDRSAVGSFLAITFWFFNGNGAITDTDIIFNPQDVFSTDHASDTYDLQTVATHEIGHALGASHSGLISATMYQATTRFQSFSTTAEATTWSTLSTDDKAFLIAAYPDSTAAGRFGRITGTVRLDTGSPLLGGLIIAVDATAGVVVGGLSSLTDGRYSISGVPPGSYQVYAQPLNGPVRTSNIVGTPNIANANTSFLTTFAGGNTSPSTITVAAGGGGTADITAGSSSALHIDRMGVGSAGDRDFAFASVKALTAGSAADILIWGVGIDSTIAQNQIRLLAPGLTVRPGSLQTQASAIVNGVVPLRMTVDVASRTTRASVIATVLKGSDMAASSGALVIVPPLPSFTSAGVVNGASGLPVIAPGSFVAIYGTDFTDTETSWDSAIFDGKTLPMQLGGVRVRINGKSCFVNFVRPTQVNVLTPADTASGPVTVEVTTGSGTRIVTVTMGQLSPAFFVYSLGGVLYPAALYANSSIYVAAVGALPGVTSRPAASGDNLVLFATGLGTTSPPSPVGQVLTTAYPIGDLTRLRVTVGGVPATVLFAGLTFAGVYQVNIQVPGGIGSGNLPVVLTIDGQPSQSGTVLAFQ